MKKTSKIWSKLLPIFSVVVLIAPILSSCSCDLDLKLVSRGDGQYFSKYKNGQDEYGISFKEQISNAMMNSSSFKEFKKQYANEMLYNWYKNIVDSGNKQSFKDNWKQWKKDIDSSWDDLVKNAKETHKEKWKYFLQNETLNPVGGTEQAWRYEQLCSKIRDEFKTLVFNNNYFAYSKSANVYDVNAPIERMNSESLKDSNNWRKINFYAYANSSYSGKDSGDLDPQFALIQKETFNWYTAKNHPILSGMSLWKNAAPSSGTDAIYSKALGSITIDDKSGLTFPGFSKATTSSANANTKFWDLFSEVIGKSYYLADNGLTNLKTNCTDDSSVQYLTTMNSAFSNTNKLFASAEARLWDKGIAKSGGTSKITDHYIRIRASQLASTNRNDMDLLSLFAYKSNDSRLVSGNAWNELGTQITSSKYTTDLAAHYDYDGAQIDLSTSAKPTSDFHSKIFTSGSSAMFDYYGTTSEGGVRYIINAIQLTTDDDKDLPYVLIRDDYGIHLIGIDGIMNDKGENGYLLQPASTDNDETKPMSQGRENILFKAQAMYDKLGLKSGGTDLNSKLKTYFGDNLDDIVISMAAQQIDKDGKTKSNNPIFNDLSKNKTFSDSKRESLYNVIELGNKLFQLQETISTFDNANKSLFSDNLTYVNNGLINKSINTSTTKPTLYDEDNNKNGLSTPFPYTYTEGDYKSISSGSESASNEKAISNWQPTQILNWVNTDSFNLNESLKNDVWSNSYINYRDLKDIKSNYQKQISSLIDDIAPYIATDEFGKLSEKINTQWELDNEWYDDGTKKESGKKVPTSIKNAIYKSLNDFASDAKFANSTKAKAMKAYAKDLYQNENNIDANTGYVTIPNESIANAVTSLYYTKKVITDSTPLSMYQQVNANNYIDFVNKSYSAQLFNDYLLNGSNSDSMLDYWTYLDTVTYLMKDNYSNLFRYLSNTVLNSDALGYFTWLAKDNTVCNSNFKTDGTYDQIFGWQDNYKGYFDSQYLNPEKPYSKPSSYVSNDDYYKFAKIPGSTGDFQMGYAGLVTQNNTPSSITENIKKAMFTNSYYSNITIENNTTHHWGGWYGFGDFKSILDRFDAIGSATDLKQVCNSLETNNKDVDFIENVVSIIDRTTYVEGDPEINPQDESAPKVGDYVTLSVMKDRVIGKKQIYKDRGWGIISYAKYNESTKEVGNDNVKDLLKPAQTNASTGEFAMQIYSGNPLDTNPTHLIDDKTDTSSNQARVAVVQICSNDIKSYNNFKARFNKNDTIVNEFLGLLVAQYASNTSLQTQATSDVIRTIYQGNKITVFDRTLNDKLGQTWVKDYKETN